jgi:Holliday junction resolvase RusA-like endonuclease
MIQVTLPYPPSVNHYWRHVGPRVLVSRQGRAFREQVRSVLAAWGVRPLAGPIRVVVELFPPDRRRRDCDNAMKALLDSLQYGGAYHDDSQIVRLEITKHAPVAGGESAVRIEEWDEPASAAVLATQGA